MAKKTLPKIKTTKMGDLEEKVDSAPKKRRGRPKKLQTKAEVDAAINLKEFQKSEAKLKKEKEKTISARKLFKTLEVDIQAANASLSEIGGILKADFAARIDQEKAEIAMLQQDSSKQKIKAEEKGLEKKSLGSKIKDQAKKGMAPIKSMTDKLIELATFLLIGITGNAVFEFMKSDTFKAAWRGFTKFIIKGTAWLFKTTAAFIGFFSIKNLFKLFKKGIKFLLDIPKKIFSFAKNLFKLPKRIRVTSKLIKRSLKKKFGKKVTTKVGTKVSKKVTTQIGKKVVKKAVTKNVAKAASKSAAKGVGKSVLKKIPFVGLGLGAAFAIDRLRKGDWGGALMELGSGAASMIPGAGTAISVGLDAALIAKDIGDAKKEQEQGEVTEARVGKRVTKGDRVLVGEGGPELLEMPFTGTIKHATETLNTLKDEAGQDGGVEIVDVPTTPIMAKPGEVAEVADEKANPSEFISSYNKLNDYMNTTPDALGMTV